MIELKKDVVYVKGAMNGAIYDFHNQKVYKINAVGCTEIERYLSDNLYCCDYINMLSQMGLLDISHKPNAYIPEKITPSLDMAWLEITQGCNMRCLHCYEGNTHTVSENIISLSKWLDIIHQLYEIRIKRVVVIGGEPCVSPFLMSILSELCRYKIPTTLFTNATLLTAEQIAYIASHREIISIKTSIYGHNSEVHDQITTVKGSFEKLNKNINSLLSQGVTVNAAVVVMKENQNYLQDIIDYVKESGMKYTRYDVIRNVFGGSQDIHTPTDTKIINSVRYTHPNFSITKQKFDSNAYFNSCWKSKLAITEDGRVIPCVFERNIVIGNITQSSIKEILASSMLHSCWCHTLEMVDICRDCEFRFACKDCRPLGISVSGKLYDKNPRCTYNPYTGQWEDNI